MMCKINKIISLYDEIFKDYPEFVTRSDMIHLGIFASRQAAWQAHQEGDVPRHFKLKRKVLYPKRAVIEWLTNRTVGKSR